MSSTKARSDGSALARAAYATLNPAMNGAPTYVTALVDGAGMSATQAREFTDRFDIVDHRQNTADGFSATVFRDQSASTFSK